MFICVQLLDLQLSDSNFRRYVLLQYLILFHYLNAQVRFKTLVTFVFYVIMLRDFILSSELELVLNPR